MDYPEIGQLEQLIKTHSIQIDTPGKLPPLDDYFKSVTLNIKNNFFDLYVYDEYDDLVVDNQPLCLCLVLLELEEYQEEDDYLTWCTTKGLKASIEQLRSYYMGLSEIYRKIEAIIGFIECPISSFDFELNAGAAQALRSR